MNIGYASASTRDPELALELEALSTAGRTTPFQEKVSGPESDWKRPRCLANRKQHKEFLYPSQEELDKILWQVLRTCFCQGYQMVDKSVAFLATPFLANSRPPLYTVEFVCLNLFSSSFC